MSNQHRVEDSPLNEVKHFVLQATVTTAKTIWEHRPYMPKINLIPAMAIAVLMALLASVSLMSSGSVQTLIAADASDTTVSSDDSNLSFPDAKPFEHPRPVDTSQVPEVTTPAPAPVLDQWTVKDGDTLIGIARQLGVDWKRIWGLNLDKIQNPHVIHVGWVLNLMGNPQPVPDYPIVAPSVPTADPANPDLQPEAASTPAPAPSLENNHDWTGVVQCESTMRWNVNTGNGYYGGLQFGQPTWEDFGGLAFASRADLATPAQQIHIAEQVLKSNQGIGAWPSCGKNIKDGTTPLPDASAPPVTQDVQIAAASTTANNPPASNNGWAAPIDLSASDVSCGSPYGQDRGTYAHGGQDIPAPIGTEVYAARGGIVQRSAEQETNGYGLAVMVFDPETGLYFVYGHVSKTFVKKGDTVKAGDKIALSGNQGQSTGPHLHFEVDKAPWENHVNPNETLSQHDVALCG